MGARPVGYIEITDGIARYVYFSAAKRMIFTAVAGVAARYLLRGPKQRNWNIR